MRKILISVAVSAFFFTTSLQAQVENSTITSTKPDVNPVIVDVITGSRYTMYQLVVNKKFLSIPKLGFFSVTEGTSPWKREDTPELMTQAHLTYRLFKGFDILGGMQYTSGGNFRPATALFYAITHRDIFFLLNPKVEFTKNYDSELVTVLEYTPKINKSLNLYSRIQTLYSFVPNSGDHNRSYVILRAGINYKEFTFGPGAHLDWYGPEKLFKNNVGIFVRALLY
ncbi:hypothetical protein [Sphingobacterium rhinopitheci]|uniref:hypothetical protein n=1 Tax=Sphingobacterium rhinopitheci TaxID=2781960 RepID=UPI001F51F45C|nr:hypothetical protein [Sphingobacterium rhinopitheci]MCI0921928.1 hypothetical protein [Sphingobacterium rhinopitheci]